MLTATKPREIPSSTTCRRWPSGNIASTNGVVTSPSHNDHHLITGNRGERAAVRGSRREPSDNKLRQSEVTEDGPRSARNKATVMKMFARMCWATALMCPLACGAPDTHESSERTVTVYDYVAGRGQFRLKPA